MNLERYSLTSSKGGFALMQQRKRGQWIKVRTLQTILKKYKIVIIRGTKGPARRIVALKELSQLIEKDLEALK